MKTKFIVLVAVVGVAWFGFAISHSDPDPAPAETSVQEDAVQSTSIVKETLKPGPVAQPPVAAEEPNDSVWAYEEPLPVQPEVLRNTQAALLDLGVAAQGQSSEDIEGFLEQHQLSELERSLFWSKSLRTDDGSRIAQALNGKFKGEIKLIEPNSSPRWSLELQIHAGNSEASAADNFVRIRGGDPRFPPVEEFVSPTTRHLRAIGEDANGGVFVELTPQMPGHPGRVLQLFFPSDLGTVIGNYYETRGDQPRYHRVGKVFLSRSEGLDPKGS